MFYAYTLYDMKAINNTIKKEDKMKPKQTPINQEQWDELLAQGIDPESMNFRLKGVRGNKNITHADAEQQEKYAEAEVCVFPSLMETQGLVAPEAMAMEKTVVFTSLGPGPEAIIDKETGLLCNPYDIDSISNSILWVLNNPTESSLIAKRAKKYVEDNYNLNTLVQKNIDFYKSLG